MKLLLIIFLIPACFVFPQSEKSAVAKIGSIEITLDEFKDRYQFMPHLHYSSNEPDSVKKEFLYSLIAEKLWSLEALKRNYDTLDAFKYSIDNLKKFLVKDELYREEVESKINISNEDILKGLTMVNRTLKINIISSHDSSEIFEIYNSIAGLDSINTSIYDSILTSRKEYDIQKEPLDLPFGKLQEEKIEEMLFSLKPGSITEPVETGDGWFIFKIAGEEFDPSVKPSTQEAKNKVYNTIKERRERKISGAFLDKILGGRSISADGRLLEILFSNFISLLNKKDTFYDNYELTSDDLYQLLNQIDHSVKESTFIKFKEDPLTVKDFLYYLFYQKIIFKSNEAEIIKTVLNKAVRQFIEDEIIFREGLKRGLDERESVRRDLKIWQDYYLAQLLMNSYSDSINISDDELKSFYQSLTNSEDSLQVNILELFTQDLKIIETVLQELEQGKDFRDLVLKYTEREWVKNNNGETGYFNINHWGEIGEAASQLNEDEVYGPIKVPGGYSLIKLIDKKELSDSLQESFENKKFILSEQLLLRKLYEKTLESTVKFADNYEISINESLLTKAELIELNTFTFRLIGFGGKIAAFPVTTPLYKWFEKYQPQKSIP